MTEHFEDFDKGKFKRYLQEVKEVSESTGFLLIPGMEVDLFGLHTILFPLKEYEAIARLASDEAVNERTMFKVLAHPSKYPFDRISEHIEKYKINGVELWNQQADGRFIPPTEFLIKVKDQPWRNQCRFFFGCDLHSSKLAVSNIISLPNGDNRTPDGIMNALITGDFVCRNDQTGIEYRNGSDGTDFDTWLKGLLDRSYARGKILGGIRSFLKPMYRMLPRPIRRSLNDVKNYVRNKV